MGELETFELAQDLFPLKYSSSVIASLGEKEAQPPVCNRKPPADRRV